MITCKELRIFSNNLSVQNIIITLLWKLCLQRDKYFYFLYEPRFLLIRTTEDKMKELVKVLEDASVDIGTNWEVSDYKEWSKDVLDNANSFSEIMHEVSVMELSGKSSLSLYERLSHCIFHIMRVSLFAEAKRSGKSNFTESTCLASLAVDRAYTEGITVGRFYSEEDLKKVGLA